jgi:hypothetical protein
MCCKFEYLGEFEFIIEKNLGLDQVSTLDGETRGKKDIQVYLEGEQLTLG